MIVNNTPFTDFGRAFKRGDFDKLDPESLEYINLWDEQLDRCLNGCSIGGKYMSGLLYSYINFGSIDLLSDNSGRKTTGLPLLRDVEWEVFSYIEKAKELKKNLLWVSGRRGGKSYIGSFIAAYNYAFFKVSSSLVGAGDSEKLDETMQKVSNHIHGFDKTEFFVPVRSKNYKKEILSGYEVFENNRWVVKGTGRKVEPINFHQRHTAANGKSCEYFFWEEIGMFDNLIESYNSSEPCWKEGSEAFGFAFLAGTGGDMDRGSLDAHKMFYDPETYNLLVFEDEKENKTGYFLAATKVLNDFKDAEGNTDVKGAEAKLLEERERKRKGNDLESYLSFIQYYPLTAEEAFLSTTGNIFPVALLQRQVEKIYLDSELRNKGKRGHMIWDDGEVKFVLDQDAREVAYPMKKGDDTVGCVAIYEEPELNKDKEIPYGLYIAGIDPYAQDSAESSVSLGSCIIKKRFYNFSKTYDIVVAEYTGRPKTANEFYEQCRRLLKHYNAIALYENNIPGLKSYFETKQCLHYLAKQPTIYRDIVSEGLVNRSHGFCVSIKTKQYLVQSINNWLLEEYAEGKYNLEKIYSLYLLKELISYNEKDNFDRVIAFGLCCIQEQELHHVSVTESNQNNESMFDSLFERYGWKDKTPVVHNPNSYRRKKYY